MITMMVLDDILHGNFEDTGCKESQTCLACPLERCIHDASQQYQNARRAERDAERARAVEEAERTMSRPVAIAQVAQRYGITERTVWRILQRVATNPALGYTVQVVTNSATSFRR